MKKLIFFIVFLNSTLVYAQFTNLNWTFGDSCGIKFNSTGIDSIYRTSVNSRGSSVSISDSIGNLLFYVASPDLELYQTTTTVNRGRIYNRQHNTMENGDSIATPGWYKELLILPLPDSTNKFVVISSMATSGAKISYSEVDLTFNNGLGKVVSKNNVLDTGEISDGITAIKHGNGRDWWIIYKKWFYTNNTIYKILLTPTGLSSITTQSIGVPSFVGSFYRLIPSKSGEFIIGINPGDGTLEKFSFDRCTGNFFNHVILNNATFPSPAEGLWDGAISPNERFLYITTAYTTEYLYQIDLLNQNPFQNKIVIDSIDTLMNAGSSIRLAPNGKMYRSHWWCQDGWNCYPFLDSNYASVNTHLSVINEPDSFGLACSFDALGQYLNGYRTYLGLPNDVNLALGPLSGSLCDTLSVGLSEINDGIPIQVSPNPSTGNFTVSIKDKVLFKEGFSYAIYSLQGQLIQQGVIKGRTSSINLSSFESGMYLLNVTLPKEVIQIKLSKL